MRLLDDLLAPDSRSSRRHFLQTLSMAGIATATLGTMTVAFRYLWPAVLFEVPTRFNAGKLTEIVRARLRFEKEHRAYVAVDDKGLYAMSAVCTHLGCLTRPEAGGDGFFCPCHGSRFDAQGKVVKGPAPKPLPHLEAQVIEGSVWVDTKKRVEDADARIPV